MKTEEEWSLELIKEHERAIKQRDSFILTGVSTASHGGSHDTCFKHVIRRIQLDAFRAGMTEAAEMINPEDETRDCTACRAHLKDVQQAIISARDKKQIFEKGIK